jgi:hypothetical protein
MRARMSVKVLSIVFLLVFFLGVGVSSYTQIQVKITIPERDGIQVGKEMTVEGTASIPRGTYLWVLVHRIKGFKYDWWPQNEAEIDPVTKKWSVDVVFGGPQDIGYDFGIAAIVVDQKEHLKLMNYRGNAMRTGDYRPIGMPPTQVAPVIRTVKKVSHN